MPRWTRRAVLAATWLLPVLIYSPLAARGPILSRDDRSLLKPLESVHGIADYIHAVREHRVLDLQPVRDASFLGDIALNRMLGFQTFHATNLILWLLIVLVAHRLMTEIYGNHLRVDLCMLVFAVHPLFAGSVAWISARKHLLACVFVLAATWLLVRRRSRSGASASIFAILVALYLAGVLSQPIVLLWPAWAAFYLWLQRTKLRDPIWIPVGVCVLLMLLVGAANFVYYTRGYVQVTGMSKLAGDGATGTGVLAFGRYFANFIAPVSLATQYSPGRWLDLFGLAAFGAAALLLLRADDRRGVLAWGSFYVFPLALVTIRMTNIYVSDTYALTSGVGLMGLALLAAESFPWTPSARTAGIAACLAVATWFSFASAVQGRAWMSDEALWEQAARVEPSPTTIGKHAHYLIERGQIQQALAELESLPPEERVGAAGSSYAQAIYRDPTKPAQEKARILEAEAPRTPMAAYYLAAIDAGQGQFSTAWDVMRHAFDDSPQFGEDTPVIAAETSFFCRQAGVPDCDARMEAYRQRIGGWDVHRYQTRLASLIGH